MVNTKLQTLRGTLKLDEVQDLLEDTRAEAASSRKVLRSTFAKAYVWYQRALALTGSQHASYLEDTFKAEIPPITSKKGVSEYSRVVKLAFNMNVPKFASTVSKYALVLDHIDRQMNSRKNKPNKFDEKFVEQLIEAEHGVHECVKSQRAWLDQKNKPAIDNQKLIADHLFELSVDEYRGRKSIALVEGKGTPTNDGFVLLMGRATDEVGKFDAIDVLDADEHVVDSLIVRNALRNSGHQSPTINLLGDTLSLASVIRGKPWVTVEKGGKEILVSLGKEAEASVIVQAFPKNGALSAFAGRATFTHDSREWLKKNISDGPSRCLYSCKSVKSSQAVAELEFTNTVTKEKSRLRANKPTENTKQQVVRDRSVFNAWHVELPVDTPNWEQIYIDWLLPWARLAKEPGQKHITLGFTKKGISFGSPVRPTGTYALTTKCNLKADVEVNVSGSDLANVIRCLRNLPTVNGTTIRAHDSGVVEIEAGTPAAEYIVTLPAIDDENGAYNSACFSKLPE